MTAPQPTTSTALLDVTNLSAEYPGRRGRFRGSAPIRVLDNLNLRVERQETLGLVGESGCGKTTLLFSLLRLITPTGGKVLFEGEDILTATGSGLRKLRQNIQVVFQNPFSSLDPHMTVQRLVDEPLRVHTNMIPSERRARAAELLDDVGLSARFLSAYPHQMSGGQAQRVALARALALKPKLLLLDEPTSSLDVSVQAQVLNLLMKLQVEHGLTYLFVSHDLEVVQHIGDRIAVMYLGQIAELGDADSVFERPGHPYTQALMSANRLRSDSRKERVLVRGDVPSFAAPPPGCRFNPRCPFVMDICRTVEPPPIDIDEGHWATCHLLDDSSRHAHVGVGNT